MKKIGIIIALIAPALVGHAQEMVFPNVTVMLSMGAVQIKEGTDFSGRPKNELYSKVLDSVSTVLKSDPRDTSGLFLKALFMSKYQLQRYPGDDVLAALEESAAAIDTALAAGMDNLMGRILRADIYYQLKDVFVTDEDWKYKTTAVRKKRKAKFESYQALSNRYNEELQKENPGYAYEYGKRIKVDKYPLKVD